MKTFTAISSLAAVGLAAVGYAKAAKVGSPAVLIQCQPAAITWTEATGTVYLSVVLGDDVASPAYVTFPEQSGASGSYTWPRVNVSSGSEVTFVINDGTGVPNYSSQISINAGSSDSCIDDDDDDDSSSSGGSSSGGGSGSSSSPSSSTRSSSPSSSSRASTGTSSSAPASSSTTSSSSSGGNSGALAGVSIPNLNTVAVVGAAFAGAAYFL